MLDEMILVRVKRAWVPEWLFTLWKYTIPPWVWPFRQIITVAVERARQVP